eukprot:8087388-Alexandrium_andersonii.AAC.1
MLLLKSAGSGVYPLAVHPQQQPEVWGPLNSGAQARTAPAGEDAMAMSLLAALLVSVRDACV